MLVFVTFSRNVQNYFIMDHQYTECKDDIHKFTIVNVHITLENWRLECTQAVHLHNCICVGTECHRVVTYHSFKDAILSDCILNSAIQCALCSSREAHKIRENQVPIERVGLCVVSHNAFQCPLMKLLSPT